jgi:RNA polymerase sigma-70 factor (ECF subfamily)
LSGYCLTIEDDHDLVEAALVGDRGAVDRLLRRHYHRLFALCRRLTGDDADAADAAQEALIAISRGLAAGRFDRRSRFSTWAYRVATNATLDELRRRRRRPSPVPADDLGPVSAGGGSTPPGDEAVSDRLVIDAALRQLPAEFRAAVVLRDLCQLDYAEISEVLDVPVGTVRSRIARGRAALARSLGNPAPSPTRPNPAP